MKNAAIIAIGSEMLTPQRVDTNSLWLTDKLNALGVEVVAKYVIGDDRARLVTTITQALETVDFLLISGGLGPTEDDLTRDAVALALHREQHFHAPIAEAIEARFIKMNRVMPEINKRQAMVIAGAEILTNDRGTAPGQWIALDGKVFDGKVVAILPGPPHELKAMFDRECQPRFEKLVPPVVIRTLALRISGMSESELDQTISPIYTKYENPVTTVLAHNGDMQVHFRARCGTVAAADALLSEIRVQVDKVLGDKIYSHEGEPLEAVIGRKLKAQNQTLAVAESATGGSLADRITSVAGSSAWFLGGFITYARQLKQDLLGIPAELIATHGAVSAETAKAMAEAARTRTKADWAIAVTGNAGPATDGDEAPVGAVYVAIAGPNGTEANHRIWPASDRPRVRAFAGQMALDMLNRRLPG